MSLNVISLRLPILWRLWANSALSLWSRKKPGSMHAYECAGLLKQREFKMLKCSHSYTFPFASHCWLSVPDKKNLIQNLYYCLEKYFCLYGWYKNIVLIFLNILIFFSQHLKYFIPLSSCLHGFWEEVINLIFAAI